MTRKLGSRIGEFDRPWTGACEFIAEDLLPGARHFGLQFAESWMTAHVRSVAAPDRHYHLLRPFRLGTTIGVMAAISRDDGVYYSERSRELFRGGSVRRFADPDSSINIVGTAGFYGGLGGPTLSAKFTGETMTWDDSGHLKLAGECLGRGHYLYFPWPQSGGKGTVHAHFYYSVSGVLFGDEVAGIVAFESGWLPPETLWGENPIQARYQGTWCAFGQVFDDGSTQYGHLVDFTDAGSFASIMDNGKHIRQGLTVTDVDYHDDGFARRIEVILYDGDKWEFVTEQNGALVDQWNMGRRAGQNFRSHKGYCGRVGETRKRDRWYAIQEIFPERLGHAARDGQNIAGDEAAEVMF